MADRFRPKPVYGWVAAHPGGYLGTSVFLTKEEAEDDARGVSSGASQYRVVPVVIKRCRQRPEHKP